MLKLLFCIMFSVRFSNRQGPKHIIECVIKLTALYIHEYLINDVNALVKININ